MKISLQTQGGLFRSVHLVIFYQDSIENNPRFRNSFLRIRFPLSMLLVKLEHFIRLDNAERQGNARIK